MNWVEVCMYAGFFCVSVSSLLCVRGGLLCRRGKMEKVENVLGIEDAESAADLQQQILALAREQEEQLVQQQKHNGLSSDWSSMNREQQDALSFSSTSPIPRQSVATTPLRKPSSFSGRFRGGDGKSGPSTVSSSNNPILSVGSRGFVVGQGGVKGRSGAMFGRLIRGVTSSSSPRIASPFRPRSSSHHDGDRDALRSPRSSREALLGWARGEGSDDRVMSLRRRFLLRPRSEDVECKITDAVVELRDQAGEREVREGTDEGMANSKFGVDDADPDADVGAGADALTEASSVGRDAGNVSREVGGGRQGDKDYDPTVPGVVDDMTKKDGAELIDTEMRQREVVGDQDFGAGGEKEENGDGGGEQGRVDGDDGLTSAFHAHLTPALCKVRRGQTVKTLTI